MSSFSTLNVALRTLQSMQRAIAVSSHNVANANTPGYSRQKALLSAGQPYSTGLSMRTNLGGQVGTGVTVESIERYRSNYLDGQIRHETASLNGWNARGDTLGKIEVIINEPSDSGISHGLTAFWGAWRDLAANPESAAQRANLVEVTRQFTSTLRETESQLWQLRNDLNQDVAHQVSKINTIAERIAQLNVQINVVYAAGHQPNDLLDQRDALATELSGIINVDIRTGESGSMVVSLGNRALVMDGNALKVRVEGGKKGLVWDDRNTAVVIGGIPLDKRMPPEAANILGGTLGGILVSRDIIVPEKLAAVNRVAIDVMEQVNTLHQSGYNLQDETGIPFFTGSSARDIEINAILADTPSRIAASASPDAPGDGSIALSIANVELNWLNSDNMTIGDSYRNFVTTLGHETARAAESSERYGILVEYLQESQSAISGVSLDEETVMINEYQRTYQAASRVITVLDEMMDKLINGTGVVGR